MVACHGTIEERWGHEIILRAAALALPEVPNLRILFTGRGNYVPTMLQLVDELGLQDVLQYPGFVSFPELGQLLMTAHVGVSAQKASEYSHVVQTGKMYEFLALGIPTIVTRLRSTAAYFTEGQVTYVEPDDHVDMARAFVELAQSPQRLQSLSDEGYAAYQTYRWEAQAMIYRDAIRRLLTR
ncbi:MAG: glycosyltransferase [Ilumatobacteraceae bacterium]